MNPPKRLKIETHIVPELNQKERLQDYAVGIFRTITSRAGIKKAIKKGLVFLNSEKGQTGDWISGGETIELFQQKVTNKPVLDLTLDVLYEDDYLAIIYKPAGVLVSGNKRFTVENALEHNLKKSQQIDALASPEPIHRLDYPTTGALLIGKTASIVIALNKMFEHKEITKCYYAVVTGTIAKEGLIENEIDSKPSKSEFTRVSSIPSEKFTTLNLLELIPHSGRRHQLRKHLHSIGHPIFGDPIYKKEGVMEGRGLYLHASKLEFTHPVTNVLVSIKAPIPKKFSRIFKEF